MRVPNIWRLSGDREKIQWHILNLKINLGSVRLSGLEVDAMCSCHHRFKTSSRPLRNIIYFLPECPVMFHWVLSSEAEISLTDNTDVWAFFTLFLPVSTNLKNNILFIFVQHEKLQWPGNHEISQEKWDLFNYFSVSLSTVNLFISLNTSPAVSHLKKWEDSYIN